MNPICECGYKFTQNDIRIDDCGPDARTVFQCPYCHCITEYDPDEVDLT